MISHWIGLFPSRWSTGLGTWQNLVCPSTQSSCESISLDRFSSFQKLVSEEMKKGLRAMPRSELCVLLLSQWWVGVTFDPLPWSVLVLDARPSDLGAEPAAAEMRKREGRALIQAIVQHLVSLLRRWAPEFGWFAIFSRFAGRCMWTGRAKDPGVSRYCNNEPRWCSGVETLHLLPAAVEPLFGVCRLSARHFCTVDVNN